VAAVIPMLVSNPMSVLRALRRALLLVALSTGLVHAQAASVSPQAVLLTDQSRVGTLHVLNPYTTPLEIVVDLRYGFVVTDSTGRAIVEMPDSSIAAPNSAVPLLRVSPMRFVLAPGEVQLVRIAAFPPPTLAAGEYWARIGVRAVQPAPTTGTGEQGISVGVGIQVKTVLPVFYRHSLVATSVQLGELTPHRSADSLIVQPTFTRSGSAAALLAVETVVTDASGGVLMRTTRQAAVYHTLAPRYALAMTPEQWSRAANVRVTATSIRPDLPAGLPLPLQPVSRVAALRAQ
jgi:P pilus assembly chaperone PapD